MLPAALINTTYQEPARQTQRDKLGKHTASPGQGRWLNLETTTPILPLASDQFRSTYAHFY